MKVRKQEAMARQRRKMQECNQRQRGAEMRLTSSRVGESRAMTKDMKRRKDREIAVSNIERQTPDRQTHTFFPHRTRNMQVKETYLARVAELPKACMKRRKGGQLVVANSERQKPDRQTHTFFPNRLRSARDKVTYFVGVEPVAVPPSWDGGSICVG